LESGSEESEPSPAGPHVASVVDLFCGAGGLAHGFLKEGFHVAAGIDVDAACKYPFEQNNRSSFVEKDVDRLSADELASLYPETGRRILVGCAPCQPFSTYNQKGRGSAKYSLVETFAELIAETQPDVVSMENVPRLADYEGGDLLAQFEKTLCGRGYNVSRSIVSVADYGLPQRRRRLVLLASKLGPIELETPDGTAELRTVADEIKELPAIRAGEADPYDPLHCASKVSPLNQRRLKASKPGGTWRDWPVELRAQCHLEATGKGYGAVYGRMKWGEPAPTITTLFYGFGNGRFGHPDQDRALSLREGAMLQSFPRDYQFIPPNHRPNMREVGRMIGNAVPVTLGRVIARSVRKHLAEHPM
jgi:DNA (cytosine-5)-methyltransferase 1